MKIHWDVPQGSEQWFKLRSGIPTASEFSSIITPERGEYSKSRWPYAIRLVAEKVLNWKAKQLDTEDVRNGREREPFAVKRLEFMHDLTMKPVGFVTTDDGKVGASPDRFVMPNLMPVEIKSPSVLTHLGYLLRGHGTAHKPQVQGQMYVCEADEAIFYSFNPEMEAAQEYMIRTPRDDKYIQTLAGYLDQFTDEVAMLMDKAESLGLHQQYTDAPEEDVPGLVEADPGMAEAIAKAGGDQS